MKGTKTKVGTSSGLPKWRLRVYVGRDELGKQHFETKTLTASARDADRELARMIELAHPGGAASSTDARKRTFAAAVELWRRKDAPKLSPATVRQYELNLSAWILDDLGGLPVTRIQPSTVARLRERIIESGRTGATANRIHATISAVLRRAVDEGWLTHNPAREVKRARESWRPPTAPKVDELARLLDAIDDEDDRAMVLLAIATGARRGELCALRWSDLHGAKLTIERSIYADTSEAIEKDTKAHASRTVTLSRSAVEVLRARRARAKAWAKRCKIALDDDGFIFSDEPSGRIPWRPDFVSHRWERIRKAAELPKVRFHDLRHYAATAALAAGADPATVRDRLGHGNVATTSLYVHGREDADAELAEALDDELSKLVG